ncbi:hypothetical protein [Pseudoalteromonas sp. bablab_jr011]|uniref:type IV pilus modification PilV family protein n=1 Tax=Pseudoalteromonas sp. bablab_jr011 TaxID=2755062 RepID=UPI0018F49C2B|nr:hypothetical protein [Pseudoalteromonas sp. bablab_jr011]
MSGITIKSRQYGAATITILLFVGVSISIAVLGSLRYIQGSQNQTMTMHAQTQAQRKAWVGVDITKKYLSALDSSELTELLESIPVKVEAEAGKTQQTLNPTISDPELQLSFYKEDLTNKTYLYAEITAEAVKGTKAHATSAIEAVFELQQTGKQPVKSCAIDRTVVLRGATELTGGGTDFLSGDALTDIAVEGSLKLTNSSKSGISGCVSGDVYMNGGGIKSHSSLYVGGNFKVESMAKPTNVGVWARDINIGNSGQGTYDFLRAGAFTTVVLDESGGVVGTGNVGGELIKDTTGSSIPWTTGTLVPTKDIPFVIETSSGGRVLVDLSDAVINESNGFVEAYAADSLEGNVTLPRVLQFVATGVTGGNIDIYTLNVGQLWGHEILSDGYDANYTTVLSNGNFSIGTGNIGSLIGGSNLIANKGGCSSNSNCSNLPSLLNPSQIAGEFYINGYSGTPPLKNLTQKKPGLSPGLPGIPFCDTRVNKVVASDYKPSANYIFEVVDGQRLLTIQNVKLADGTQIDGVYDLLTEDLRFIGGKSFLSCGWGSGHCFRNNQLWELDGISAFPPGVAWFDGPLKINGVGSNNAVNGIDKNLLNTFITIGGVELTSSGHGELIAPNFNSEALCQGDIVPTNLCTLEGDLVGDEGVGLPIANSSIVSQSNLGVEGWNITGHVTLGGSVKTAGSKVIINGGLVVGSNIPSITSVGAGGLEVNTQSLSQGQLQKDCGSGDAGSSVSGWHLKANAPIWTRYL